MEILWRRVNQHGDRILKALEYAAFHSEVLFDRQCFLSPVSFSESPVTSREARGQKGVPDLNTVTRALSCEALGKHVC